MAAENGSVGNVIWVSPNGSPGGAGTASSPLKSIQAAIDQATPGTVIKVMPGVYTENIEFKANGTAEAPITLLSSGGPGAAVIQPLDQARNTIGVDGTDNIVIDGFKIIGPQTGPAAVHIHVSTAGGGWNPPSNVTVQNNTIIAGDEDGIKVSKAEGVKIIGNQITKAPGAAEKESGIDLVGVNDSVISGNTISDVTYNGIMIKGGSTNITVEANHIDGTGTTGIEVGGYTDMQFYWPGFSGNYEAGNVRVVGNVIENTGSTALRLIGATDVLVARNTLQTDSRHVVTVDDSSNYHATWFSSDITFSGNIVQTDSWLTNRSAGTDIQVVPSTSDPGTTPDPTEPVPTPQPEIPPHLPEAVPELAQAVAPALAFSKILTGSGSKDKLTGGTGNDKLSGGSNDDTLSGQGGSDVLLGGSGNDKLSGGDQHDYLDGEAGNDTLLGQLGNDTLLGGAGKDTLEGGDGDDRLDGGADADTLRGGNGKDTLTGGAANDQLFGDADLDVLIGDAGNDRLDGGAGFDKLFGGEGNDTLYSSAGLDLLSGGSGADRFIVGKSGSAVIDDFGAGDRIGVIGTGADAFGDLVLKSDSGDTIVGLMRSGTFTEYAEVSGIAPESLSADDFFFIL